MFAIELSLIVPLLNERQVVPGFLEMLARQTGVRFEVILVDGGSVDGTRELILDSQQAAVFPMTLLESAAGRARQLNLGAEHAAAELLLFLHVDSVFPEADALCRAVSLYRNALTNNPGEQFGGHFQLEFLREQSPYSFGYYFWEWKARLDRKDCTHGDQGLLLRRETFNQVGPFDETAVLAEESRLAETLRQTGRWLLLPGRIQTSARRFETEGLAARQTLNALLMNFAALGWAAFFTRAPDVYRSQDRTAKLLLEPYLALIDELLAEMPPASRRRFWIKTGAYVRSHAWQIPFSLDARRAYLLQKPVGTGALPILAFHDRWFDLLTDHSVGRLLAAGLTWGWFQWLKWRVARGRL
ncbi:MAG TPA: TIGR04283 family arsenosugar biosynthesis glycosyltransferase [Geothermobacteraceae bacterium]|nr:TIGR04283 family arsenosugar biosynthesis glycosyltransferase [Geothermobacteraceae bacterium]